MSGAETRRRGAALQLYIASSSQQQFSHRASFVPTVATVPALGWGETGNTGSVLSPAAGEDNVFITAESHGHTTPPGHCLDTDYGWDSILATTTSAGKLVGSCDTS